ncbi:MAG TPA: carbon starvation CstA family protein [Candidatus Limnocylindrales bacterium]|nr:carbon starvation CstA family protein [Candidatus Limnocylindrales bacterium]
MKKTIAAFFWLLVALLGAAAYATLALRRNEPINSGYLVIAAVCTYAIGYRFYSKWIAARVLASNNYRATPCVVHDDGRDFVKTNKFIVFGHHFAAIAGPGPLVGPVLAAQFGYLPGTLWILIGVVLGGAVQDFVILFCSIRRDGKSLAQMVKEELNSPAGLIALLAVLAILVILLAVLALVVVKALAESPWGVFTVGATIPIALTMGCYMRFVRVGKVLEASAFGITLLLLAVWGGKLVYQSETGSQLFSLHGITLAWAIIGYGVISSSLPVWLLLAPRDYLSTFMKLGTIVALAFGILLVLPVLQLPALTRFTDGSGLVVAGKVFPFCFITIACGAVSGFHALIASGTTPKMITRENYARHVGYGAMCCESFVAIMALIAACALDPGVYFSMNVKGEPAATVAQVSALGFPVTTDQMHSLANQLGEKTLFGRTGGAATLAVGMAHIFSKAVNGRGLDLWYHFAIMFEALFILTTVDAGTRVGRYLIQSVLGRAWKPLGDPKNPFATPAAAALMVGAWGYFLIQGVRDPLGGINSLWPLFGIANQMLAAIALCLGTTIILKMQLQPESKVQSPKPKVGRPALALITLVPLVWLVAVTFTAGVQKIYHPDPRIGFLAQANELHQKVAMLEKNPGSAHASADATAVAAAEPALHSNQMLEFNNRLDAAVAGTFLVLVTAIIVLSVREWILLLSRRKAAVLHETEPVWLPDYALKETGPNFRTAAGAAVIALGLAKEWSGESHFERAQQQACACSRACESADSPQIRPAALVGYKSLEKIYVETTKQRFNGVRRCC